MIEDQRDSVVQASGITLSANAAAVFIEKHLGTIRSRSPPPACPHDRSPMKVRVSSGMCRSWSIMILSVDARARQPLSSVTD